MEASVGLQADRPAKPTRLMVALRDLKPAHDRLNHWRRRAVDDQRPPDGADATAQTRVAERLLRTSERHNSKGLDLFQGWLTCNSGAFPLWAERIGDALAKVESAIGLTKRRDAAVRGRPTALKPSVDLLAGQGRRGRRAQDGPS